MKTFQDLQALGDSEKERIDFCIALMNEHKSSDAYKTALAAEEYDAKRNVTIREFKDFLVDEFGREIVESSKVNFRLPSGFFPRFVTQLNQYLLGNGVKMDAEEKSKLGANFDIKLQEQGHTALVQGCCYGFWNNGKIELFPLTEFAALPDEETGEIKAGLRFWQIAEDKPLTLVLYEPDGYTKYIKRKEKDAEVLGQKRAYLTTTRTMGDGTIEGTEERNYPAFPIIPMYANKHHQSELVGIQDAIDCYDLIKSGFASDVNDATMVYWIFKNAGGMENKDIREFMRRLKTLHGAPVDGLSGAEAEPHTTEAPHEARVKYLQNLKDDMYEDFQIVNIAHLTSGNKTASEINAAYTPMDLKADEFEFRVLDFLEPLFALAGVNASPTFTRNKVVNIKEEVETIMTELPLIGEEMALKKLPNLTQEEVEEILNVKAAEDLSRFNAQPPAGDE